MNDSRDLSLAYSPGVAEPCLEIADKTELVKINNNSFGPSGTNHVAERRRNMRIVANGKPVELPGELSLLHLLHYLKIPAETAVIEHNGHIVLRESWATVLQEGDKVEVLQFIGGG